MLRWSKELPKISGYYWYKRDGSGDIVHVFMDGVRLVVYAGAEAPIPVEKFGKRGYDGTVLWAGPIKEPTQ